MLRDQFPDLSKVVFNTPHEGKAFTLLGESAALELLGGTTAREGGFTGVEIRRACDFWGRAGHALTAGVGALFGATL